jgi:sugar lactone lactonase YvrE
MVSASTSVELVTAQRFEHPEGLVWDGARRRLVWVDVFKGSIVSFDPSTGSSESIELGMVVGSVAPRQSGGYVCATIDGFGLVASDGSFTAVTNHLADFPTLQMNDGGVDAHGRFWSASMSFEYESKPGRGALYRLDPDGSRTTIRQGVSVGNGIGWSPDAKTMYFIDSATYRVDAFPFDIDRGTLGDRRTLAQVERALPDGLAVDTDGCVWVALFGGSEICRLTPDGRVDRRVQMPGSQVTTCAFGGADLGTLYIAVSAYGLDSVRAAAERAGHIFAIDAGVQGLPTHEFRG